MRRPLAHAVTIVIAAQPAAAAAVPAATVPLIATAARVIRGGVVVAGQRGIRRHTLDAGPAGIARTSIGGPERAIPTHIAVAATGISDRRPTLRRSRNVRGVGDGATGDPHPALGIADTDRVADVATAVDIANRDRAALGIGTGETTAARTRGAGGATKSADA